MAVVSQPSLLDTVRNVITTYKGTVGDGLSIADIAKIARVEPLTLVSSSLSGNKDLYNILHGVLNVYSAYYLQAVSILSSQLVDTRILKILDKTNPDRDLKTFLTAGQIVFENHNTTVYSEDIQKSAIKTLSLEGSKYKLPKVLKSNFSMESTATSGFGLPDPYGQIDGDMEGQGFSATVSKIDSFDKLGLTVGKVIEVSFHMDNNSKDKRATVVIPTVVKLDTMIMPTEAMTGIMTVNADEITIGSRLKDALGGRIGFIKDFILCSDLIKSQKKTMIKDPTGYYTQLLKRINNSKTYSVLSGNISMAAISSIFVISEEEESQIQRKIGGRLSNKKTREIVFNNTSAMMLVVIDNEWERVSIYIRDVDGFSQSSFDSFKAMSGKDNNIGDILKAFTLNNAPSF